MKTNNVTRKLYSSNVTKAKRILRKRPVSGQILKPAQQPMLKTSYDPTNTGYILDHIKNVIKKYKK